MVRSICGTSSHHYGDRVAGLQGTDSIRKDQGICKMQWSGYQIRKLRTGIAEVPLTSLAIEAFKSQMAIFGEGPFLFPSDRIPSGH